MLGGGLRGFLEIIQPGLIFRTPWPKCPELHSKDDRDVDLERRRAPG